MPTPWVWLMRAPNCLEGLHLWRPGRVSMYEREPGPEGCGESSFEPESVTGSSRDSCLSREHLSRPRDGRIQGGRKLLKKHKKVSAPVNAIRTDCL